MMIMYPNSEDTYVPNPVAEPSMMIGYGRVLTCRRFLKYLRDGAICGFYYLDNSDCMWLGIREKNGRQHYYAGCTGFYVDHFNLGIVIDGLGIVLCRVKRIPPNYIEFVLDGEIDEAVLATCGDASGFTMNNYVEVRR